MRLVDKIRIEVSKGNTQNAINLLCQLMKSKGINDDKFDTLIIQECNLNLKKNDFRKGIIDFKDRDIDINKIHSVILELAREVSEERSSFKKFYTHEITKIGFLLILFLISTSDK